MPAGFTGRPRAAAPAGGAVAGLDGLPLYSGDRLGLAPLAVLLRGEEGLVEIAAVGPAWSTENESAVAAAEVTAAARANGAPPVVV